MGFNLRRGITQERQDENKKDISKLSITKTDAAGSGVNFNHKSVCITGTIPDMTRKEAQAFLKKKFPDISFDESISYNTDYLITGFGIGQAKIKKARQAGIQIIESALLFPN